jgi:hypothetical protein
MARVFAVMQGVCEVEPFRGTSSIGARNLSPVTKLMVSTGAVSRYKVYRSQKFITVQELVCRQLRALPAVALAKAGVRVHRKLRSCLGAGARAKTVTNNLPLLTVLPLVFYLIIFRRAI